MMRLLGILKEHGDGSLGVYECERKKRPCCKAYMRWLYDEKAEKL